MLSNKTADALDDPKLYRTGILWLIKLGLTLSILYAGWIPQLEHNIAPTWGYDPQRYYKDANTLVALDWKPTTSINYQGILYYYGAIFYFFGHNPVIPALVNSFVTLLGTLYLIRLCYEFNGFRGRDDWKLAYLLLVPEFLWFDAMTSRETLAAVLILAATLTSGRYIVRSGSASLLPTLTITGVSLGGILAVRTSMVIPVTAAVALMTILLRRGKHSGIAAKLTMLAIGFALLAAGPAVQQYLGGYDIDYYDMTSAVRGAIDIRAQQFRWSESSLGLLLKPNDFIEWILFLPPRMVLYLAAPLPNISISASDLIDGSWAAWQRLMAIPTSVLYLLAIPYALAGLQQAWKTRTENSAPLVIHISFWVVFIAIAGGNVVIHERYRVMMGLLLLASAWHGYTCGTPAQMYRYRIVWYSILAAGATFYVGYKLL